MTRWFQAVAFAALLLLSGLSPALADHMSGTYAGIGGDEGVTITLAQDGIQVAGEISGRETGTLTGKSDGGDNLTGYLTVDETTYRFDGTWSGGNLEIRLFTESGETEVHSFVPADVPAAGEDAATVEDVPAESAPLVEEAPAEDTAPVEQEAAAEEVAPTQESVAAEEVAPVEDVPAEEAAATEATDVEYWVYDNEQQVGPLALQQVLDRIASGESNRQTQVWTAQTNEWVMIDQLPELAGALPAADETAAEVPSFYLHADGIQTGPYTFSQMAGGIEQGSVPRGTLVWQPGWPEWVVVETIPEFAAYYPPAVPAAPVYFLAVDGAPVGPLREADVRARIAEFAAAPGDLAWKLGLEGWEPLDSFPEFAEALAAFAPPPLPTSEGVTEEAEPTSDVVESEPDPQPAEDDTSATAARLPEVIDTAIRAMLEPEGMPEDVILAAIACVNAALEPTTLEERALLVVAEMEPSSEQLEALEAAHPGIQDAVNACEPPPAESVEEVAPADTEAEAEETAPAQ